MRDLGRGFPISLSSQVYIGPSLPPGPVSYRITFFSARPYPAETVSLRPLGRSHSQFFSSSKSIYETPFRSKAQSPVNEDFFKYIIFVQFTVFEFSSFALKFHSLVRQFFFFFFFRWQKFSEDRDPFFVFGDCVRTRPSCSPPPWIYPVCLELEVKI